MSHDYRSSPLWSALILTLFPEMFPGPLGVSLVGSALTDGVWELETLNIRDFATDKHATVDDRPYGGGAGMVMRPDVVSAAVKEAQRHAPEHLLLTTSPRGAPFTQAMAGEFAAAPGIILLCGRYEGIDERVLRYHDIREVSLGDYVLSGGEIAAMAMIDACVRLLPGVIGNSSSLEEESFIPGNGLLEYPQYTRPPEWEGMPAPEILRSGDHGNVDAWRREQAERLTRERRPDMWEQYVARTTNHNG